MDSVNNLKKFGSGSFSSWASDENPALANTLITHSLVSLSRGHSYAKLWLDSWTTETVK